MFEELLTVVGISAGAVVGGGVVVLFLQFITNVSRNMAHTGTNVTEEISKIAKQ